MVQDPAAQSADQLSHLRQQQQKLTDLLTAGDTSREQVLAMLYSIKDAVQLITGDEYVLEKQEPAIEEVDQASEPSKSPPEPVETIFPAQNDKSAFLKLPGEIRNRIYEHALGGQTIHFQHSPLRRTVCHFGRSREPAADIDGSPYRLFFRPMHTRHKQCLLPNDNTSIQKHIAFNLVRTCRQVYEEAALIPYANNHFSVHGTNCDLKGLVEELTAKQLAAITSLTIGNYVMALNEVPIVDPLVMRPLSGHLSIDLDIDDSTSPLHLNRTCKQLCRLAQGLSQLSDVEISAKLPSIRDMRPAIKIIQQEATGLKNALLKTAHGPKIEGKADKEKVVESQGK